MPLITPPTAGATTYSATSSPPISNVWQGKPVEAVQRGATQAQKNLYYNVALVGAGRPAQGITYPRGIK